VNAEQENIKFCFMKKKLLRIACLLLSSLLLTWEAPGEVSLTILHVNDTHSQLDPLPSDEPVYSGMGGIVRREALCRSVRAACPLVLYFESGDFVQGTPYFNFFQGEAEISLMNRLKPDAVTLGNHEFDNGIEALAIMLSKADFPIVCTNYEVSKTPLKRYVKPWLIIQKGGLRIGVVSANIHPSGLITASHFKDIRWLDPIKTADSTAQWLKETKKCQLVICLSHLGYDRDNGLADDRRLAAESAYMDVILGGHTHTFMKQPVLVTNRRGQQVIIHQAGKSGVYVGRLDLLVN
jgi:5'-nucleotidase